MDSATPSGHTQAKAPEKILVFHIGSLGDTLLVIPSFHILKAHFAPARLTLLCDIQAGSNYVLATDVLTETGLIDSVITYVVSRGRLGWAINLLRKAILLLRLRATGFHTLAYLVEVYRGDRRIERDRWFFKLAGIRRVIGMEGLEQRPVARGFAISRVAHRADELLNRLAVAGIPVPPPGQGSLSLNLQPAEIAAFEHWRRSLPRDSDRPWVGVGPGSKMPAKVWPSDRFQRLIQQLIGSYDIWPVIFGGGEDADLGNKLVRAWGRGYVAAGTLGVRPSAVGLSRCLLYVGNDTGTMHLAAAAGIPCVAIFSSRESPGRWDPYGPGHQVLRTAIDCAGCCLIDCVERARECLMAISVDDVFDACRAILNRRLPQAHRNH